MLKRPEGSRAAPAPRNKAPKPAPTKQRTVGQMQAAAVKRRLAQQKQAERRQIGNAVNRGVGGPTPTITPTPRPVVTPTPRPVVTPTPRPTSTSTPRPTTRPTSTSTPRPTTIFNPGLTATPGPDMQVGQTNKKDRSSELSPLAGSMVNRMFSKGGMAKKKGYAKGGVMKANAGASMKPNRKAKK